MSQSVSYMRDALKQMYPGSHRWAKRVDQMADGQVLAIYNRKINSKTTKGN